MGRAPMISTLPCPHATAKQQLIQMIPKTIKNIIFVLSPLLLQNHSCRNLVAISPTLNRHVWSCNVSIFNQVSPNVKHRCVSRPHEQFNLEDDSAPAAAAWFSIQPGGPGGVCYFYLCDSVVALQYFVCCGICGCWSFMTRPSLIAFSYNSLVVVEVLGLFS